MYKINVVCVGKLKEDYLRAACAEYLKRLSRFADVKVVELPEGRTPDSEAPAILRAARGRTVALCVEGDRLSSESFAERIKSHCARGGELTFIIGSSYGLSDEVKMAADAEISFSDMTFPHQLMRVILLEQIYRAFMINCGAEYHK